MHGLPEVRREEYVKIKTYRPYEFVIPIRDSSRLLSLSFVLIGHPLSMQQSVEDDFGPPLRLLLQYSSRQTAEQNICTSRDQWPVSNGFARNQKDSGEKDRMSDEKLWSHIY